YLFRYQKTFRCYAKLLQGDFCDSRAKKAILDPSFINFLE
ncbi:hypothetical protein DBR06_SOUSAS38610006, partial [Sousa chinensis]